MVIYYCLLNFNIIKLIFRYKSKHNMQTANKKFNYQYGADNTPEEWSAERGHATPISY